MEVFRSELYYIFVRQESSLWWNRVTGAFSVKSAWDLSDIEDIECLGITDGILGIVEHSTIYEPRLMIIKESVAIGQLYFHHTIYKIKSICILNMGTANQELELSPCTKHNSSANSAKAGGRKIGGRLFENSAFLNKTVGAVKNVSNTIKTTTQQAATQVKQTVKKQRDPKLAERFEQRLTDELHKIFDNSDSFYYSRTLDLTNSLQRQYEIEKILEAEEGNTKPITDITRWWKHVDERFFWNKHMLKDIIALESPACDDWILPIIQGCVQLSQLSVGPPDPNPLAAPGADDTFTLGLISRRSRHQAGTRYNRRGIEPGGKVANYVETEQIVSLVCADTVHRAAFLQVRGSIPIFWSQPDYKFRPPPKLDKTEDESHAAFTKHFDEELSRYGRVCIINLVEQAGRERVLCDAYTRHVRRLDRPQLVYATFDFHEYCRGMRYENVSVLVGALADVIADMGFTWRDGRGLICAQAAVFRVNCVDCLDRTNVVQTALGRYVLELQLCRLGLGAPGSGLPPALRAAFLAMWADSGDLLSRQYAGTKALKGDYTRTGERKFTGMMKDGVASANRYYLSTFKDALRQVAVDVMTGQARAVPDRLIVPDAIDAPLSDHEQGAVDTAAMAQHVKQLIDDCKKLLVDTEPVLGSWGLIDADPHTGDPHETEMDSVLVLTAEALHVADYDETSDRLLAVQRVPLADITAVELGTLDQPASLFGVGRRSEALHCVRVSYSHEGEAGYYRMFRSTALRFFNNMAVAITTKDEMIESLHSICESILVARDVAGLPPIPFHDGVKLDRRKSKVVGGSGKGGARSSLYADLSRLPALTRNVSETQLVADIRSAGSKALNNMSEQFSKLNKLGHSLAPRARPALNLKLDHNAKTKKIFTLGPKTDTKKKGSLSDGMSSDYSSDDENRTNIFEPTLDNFEHMSHYIGDQKKKEDDYDLVQNPLYSSKIEPHDEVETNSEPAEKQTLKTPSSSKKNPFDSESITPEIQVDSVPAKPVPPSSLVLNQKLSQSSGFINFEDDKMPDVSYTRSNSQHEITLNIAQSHSESALLRSIASPVTSAREMVLSPLSKLARGVQSLSANLDPRKIKSAGAVKHITEQQYEEHRRLQEMWQGCSTRLIAL
ncbi:phosphatidylinositide phosphatase SAC2 [Aricia agestis]|uniref:phosphatidylinositide phosphatase SAC2 n=1 Tax=Aricia agestis TaxID=91739 RepID=UPI001C207CC1|nr:phosphatidylinositide phosphatase SAC2 [Aricia agestis]